MGGRARTRGILTVGFVPGRVPLPAVYATRLGYNTAGFGYD